MTGVEADTPEPVPPERRLHPWSWLFVLVQQLKQFLLPLVVLLLFGRGSSPGGFSNELWGLIAVGVLALISVWQYFTYRYRIEADSLVVRSGLFERSLPIGRLEFSNCFQYRIQILRDPNAYEVLQRDRLTRLAEHA